MDSVDLPEGCPDVNNKATFASSVSDVAGSELQTEITEYVGAFRQ